MFGHSNLGMLRHRLVSVTVGHRVRHCDSKPSNIYLAYGGIWRNFHFQLQSFDRKRPGMAQSLPPSVRKGYIRTVSHPSQDAGQVSDLLNTYVRQTAPSALENGEPRHKFLLGAANSSDARILDALLCRIALKSPPSDMLEQCPGQGYPPDTFRGMHRSDVQLRISESRTATKQGRQLLQKCDDEGILTLISGGTDKECDEIMLEDSQYLIDFHTPQLFSDYFLRFQHDHSRLSWFDRARAGVPQDDVLTNPKYHAWDASRWRLAERYAGHGWRAKSGLSKGNGPWRCSSCGGKCKRGRCKVLSPAYENSTKHSDERDDEWVTLPAWGDRRWAEMTASDLAAKFWHGKRLGMQRDRRWQSVDTFSSE